MARRSYYGRRRRRSGGWLWGILFLLIGAAAAFVWFSPRFERVPPGIEMKGQRYWNPTAPISIRLYDNAALGHYRVSVSDGARSVVLAEGDFVQPRKDANLSIKVPEHPGLDPTKAPWKLRVELSDRSLWNLGRGNRAVAVSSILIDRKAPSVAVVAKSPSIVRGGSALLIFRATDKNLRSVWVEAGGRRWHPIRYRRKGYFATLLAWPFRIRDFRARIVAVDSAGNKTVKRVAFELIYKKYRVSWIGLSDRFLNGKIAELAGQYPEISKYHDPLKRFKMVNEWLRQANEKVIHTHTSKVTPVDFRRWRLHAFYPLKGAKRVADFGDERHYYYKDRSREVSRSYHLGYDLASVRQAPIVSSNGGKVVFADYNGIYGNMPIIDHGFGLYTLYGHCSSLLVDAGEKVRPGEVIAKTGMTGLALGDHLHFGILVQGVEVLPMDWMKQNWIKSHIDAVFRQADRIIATHPANAP
ncbi:M23 family metallopeptidase [Nitratifractor sp.]